MTTRNPRHPLHLVGSLIVLIAAGLFSERISDSAHAASARGAVGNLAGWWLAIDDTFPQLWKRGATTPAEELLIINRDGRVEDRVFNFWSGSPESCAKTKVCSDAPLLATARLAVRGAQLRFNSRRANKGPFDSGRGSNALAKAAVTATPRWALAIEDDGARLVLTDSKSRTKRIFVRVAPKSLQRVRAGMLAAALPAGKHWRCFLANATAREPGFAPIRGENNAAPDFLPDYLEAASYLATLNSMLSRPTPDDPASRKLIGRDTEEILIEDFKDLRLPVTMADKKKLDAQNDIIMQRVRNATPAARLAGAPAAPPPPAPAVKIALSSAGIAALARARGDEPAAKALFCKE